MNLSHCQTDSHSQTVLLGEFSEHGKSSTTRILDCVTEWIIDGITDTGLACIGTVLTTNSTLKILKLRNTCTFFPKATDKGLVPFWKNYKTTNHLRLYMLDIYSS